MDNVMTYTGAVCMGLGLSACAGLRAWMPLLALSILSHCGMLELNEHLTFLASTPALITLTIATIIETIGDKIPAVGEFLSGAGAMLSPIAGAVIASSVLTGADTGWTIIIGICAGSAPAAAVAAGKVAVRGAVNTMTLGFGGSVQSFFEDAAALITAVLSVVMPLITAVIVTAGLFFIVRFIIKKTAADKEDITETAALA